MLTRRFEHRLFAAVYKYPLEEMAGLLESVVAREKLANEQPVLRNPEH